MLNVLINLYIAIGLMSVVWTILMVGDLCKALRRKAESETKAVERMKIGDRTAATTELLKIIDELVSTEVAERMSFLLLANQKYNILNLNDDVNEIGKKIFDSLKKEALLNEEILVNEDYLMSYIVTELTLSFTTSMKQLNVQIAANSDNNKN